MWTDEFLQIDAQYFIDTDTKSDIARKLACLCHEYMFE